MKDISIFTRHIAYIKLRRVFSYEKINIEDLIWTIIKYKTKLNIFQELKQQISLSVKENILDDSDKK